MDKSELKELIQVENNIKIIKMIIIMMIIIIIIIIIIMMTIMIIREYK